jgi:hypothetical protein
MPRPLRTSLAVARCQGGAALVVGVVGVVAVAHVLPMEPTLVPGRPDVRTVIWPLVPALAALAVPVGASARWRPWSLVTARPPWQGRMAFLATVAAAGLVTVALAPVDRGVVARNLLLFDGLALAAVALTGRPTWALVLAVPVLTWFTGVDPPDRIRWWAIPLRPPGDRQSWVVAVAVGLAGAALHLLLRPSGLRSETSI